MLALFISATVVAVERFINRRRLKVYEILRDVGWLTLVFALIEFAYLMFVEAATLNFGSAVYPLWYTEWGVFRSLLLETGIGTLLILTSVWLEQAGIAELPLRRLATPRRPLLQPPPKPQGESPATSKKCDVEW